jgi:hypothetical protein
MNLKNLGHIIIYWAAIMKATTQPLLPQLLGANSASTLRSQVAFESGMFPLPLLQQCTFFRRTSLEAKLRTVGTSVLPFLLEELQPPQLFRCWASQLQPFGTVQLMSLSGHFRWLWASLHQTQVGSSSQWAQMWPNYWQLYHGVRLAKVTEKCLFGIIVEALYEVVTRK